MREYCIRCGKVPPHGYLRGRGIYLEYLCKHCYYHNTKAENISDSAKTTIQSKRKIPNVKEENF